MVFVALEISDFGASEIYDFRKVRKCCQIPQNLGFWGRKTVKIYDFDACKKFSIFYGCKTFGFANIENS